MPFWTDQNYTTSELMDAIDPRERLRLEPGILKNGHQPCIVQIAMPRSPTRIQTMDWISTNAAP